MLFCVLFVGKCLLPLGDNPIAVNKYIISYHIIQSAPEGGNVFSHKYWPPLPIRRYPSYSFLLEAEPTSEPHCDRKDEWNEKSNDPIRNRTSNLPACSAVSEPTAPSPTPKETCSKGKRNGIWKKERKKNKRIFTWKVGSQGTRCSAARHCRSMIHSLSEVDDWSYSPCPHFSGN